MSQEGRRCSYDVYHCLLGVPTLVLYTSGYSGFLMLPLGSNAWKQSLRGPHTSFKTVLHLQTCFMNWHHVVYTHMQMHAQWFVSWTMGMWGVFAVCGLNFLTSVSLNFEYIILCTVLGIFTFWNWVALTIISHVWWNIISLAYRV